MLKQEKFKVYKIFRVPTIHANESWLIDIPAPYIMVANNHQLFQFIDETQLSNCLEYKTDESVICDFSVHFFTSQVSHCIWNIFSQLSNDNCNVTKSRAEDKIISLEHDNNWIFVMQATERVMILCDDQVYYSDMYGEGILHINDGCEVKHTKFHIDAQRNYNENRGELILPTLKHFTHYNVIHKQLNKNEFSKYVHENLTNLYLKLEAIKQQSKLPNKLDYHDVHHYILIYSSIFLVTMYMISRYLIKIKNNRPRVSKLSITRAISMPNLAISLPNLSSGECRQV